MLNALMAHQIMRGTLEAIASFHAKWKTPEAAWQAFGDLCTRQGNPVALSLEERPPYLHEIQRLYEFGIDSCPAPGRPGFLRLAGRCFAGIILRERLPDLVATCLAPAVDIPASLENLFLRFMEQYSRDLYRITARRTADEVFFQVTYSDEEGVARQLHPHRMDANRTLKNSLVFIASTVNVCLEYLLDPWEEKHLAFDEKEGSMHIHLVPGTKFNYKKLVETLTRFSYQLEKRHQEELFTRDLEHDLILQSPLMRDKWERIRVASATDELILLRGEPGTGKTHLARRIHEMSSRKDRPFVEVGLTADLGGENMVQSHLFGHTKGAFTGAHEDRQGLFSFSHTGTIFLDEIGDASPDLQSKLLRVIETKTFKPLGSMRDVTVDVRIIAATNRNLEAMAKEGRFREDLYQRLNVIQIEMPPLRERAEEIPILIGHFLRRVSVDIKKPVKPLAPDVARFLEVYPWPGNIRELIHVLKYALLFSQSEAIARKDLPEYLLKLKPGSPAAPARPAPPASGSGSPEVINFENLRRLLAESESTPVAKGATPDHPWHVDYAKKTYMRALIQHFRGNLRKILSYWDCDSEKTLRTSIKSYGLWEELERARDGR